MTTQDGVHSLNVPQSQAEYLSRDDGSIRYDYHTAHNRVGDPDYQTPIPETCVKCARQAEEAEKKGQTRPTRVDDEWKTAHDQ